MKPPRTTLATLAAMVLVAGGAALACDGGPADSAAGASASPVSSPASQAAAPGEAAARSAASVSPDARPAPAPAAAPGSSAPRAAAPAAPFAALGSDSAQIVRITVYKSPTCGCCSDWITHLEQNGFVVEAHDVSDVGMVKRANGIPDALGSCHTAFVGGYVVEGHVPAEDVKRLLAERPKVAGLAVPGMPIGSPGMEGPNPERYQVLAFDGSGRTQVFATHGP